MPAPKPVGQLLDTHALARYVDRLPVPAAAKPIGLRPSPAAAGKQVPYYRIAARQFQAQVHRGCATHHLLGL